MKKLVAVGPNPAWQKTLFFERFRENGINRAREMQAFPAGKGINFCRAVRCHGRAEGRLIQFAGGDTGRRVCEELAREGMPAWTVETGAATRTCNTCLCESTRTMTEIIEPSYAATTPEVENCSAILPTRCMKPTARPSVGRCRPEPIPCSTPGRRSCLKRRRGRC